jgi:hypothetical protein
VPAIRQDLRNILSHVDHWDLPPSCRSKRGRLVRPT